jgi:phenylalanyl-tRNA synthetase alpha chain
MSWTEELQTLRAEGVAAFQRAVAAGDATALESARVEFLGVKGRVKAALKKLGSLPGPERPAYGKAVNAVAEELKTVFTEIQQRALAAPSGKTAPFFDWSEPLPPEMRPDVGKTHPLTRTVERLSDLLRTLGFEVVWGPEVEDERHNFDDLNIPADHPSRDSFDTFMLGPQALLRSQTSTVQIRIMETRKPPLRVVAPGRVYRPDKIDATHASTFHQIEGLYVERNVSMADLRGTLQLFVEGLFGPGTKTRFRPSFFPFTEPSAELDCTCPACGGVEGGCNICKRTGWVELGGCGMVDPAVFEAVNRTRGDNAYDPELWTGFAFGFGIERLTMRRHGINDIRLFLENDLRFLRQI